MKRVKPTKFIGVPRVWEKIADKLKIIETSNKGLKKLILSWAKSVSTKHHERVRQGYVKENEKSLSYKLANRLVFRYIFYKIEHEMYLLINFTGRFMKP